MNPEDTLVKEFSLWDIDNSTIDEVIEQLQKTKEKYKEYDIRFEVEFADFGDGKVVHLIGKKK